MNNLAEPQLTQEQAIELFNSKTWESWSLEERAKFQLFQERLCMPFPVFHEAVENLLGRSVWTHEFADQEGLIKEYLGDKPKPSFGEIFSMIPNLMSKP